MHSIEFYNMFYILSPPELYNSYHFFLYTQAINSYVPYYHVRKCKTLTHSRDTLWLIYRIRAQCFFTYKCRWWSPRARVILVLKHWGVNYCLLNTQVDLVAAAGERTSRDFIFRCESFSYMEYRHVLRRVYNI